MKPPTQPPENPESHPVCVTAGSDRFGEARGLEISVLTFKVVPQDSAGLLIVENTFHAPGGPARHLHHEQDEWFYVLEGDFIIEVGSKRFHLQPGDSLLAPRQVPHVWANLGSQHSGSTQAGSLQPGLARARSPDLGRMLITFTPAGSMEAFFRKVTAADAMPSQDPALWRAHGMELLGPPLPVA